MIQNLSETVVIPIAGMILTFVLVYELIQMILEKNNMHDDVCSVSYTHLNTLWNAAEAIEKQWNSQLARRIVLAIPVSYTHLDVYKRQLW